jgi:hypothetical protein
MLAVAGLLLVAKQSQLQPQQFLAPINPLLNHINLLLNLINNPINHTNNLLLPHTNKQSLIAEEQRLLVGDNNDFLYLYYCVLASGATVDEFPCSVRDQ